MASQTLTIHSLRRYAIAQSLFPPASLQGAIDRLGFVQADPIRSPARAQDLILRHRVKGYRAGDLERHYASLAVEEDVLYAYGFLSRPVWQLLHPRKTGRLRTLEQKVLEVVRTLGEAHPRALESHLGARRIVNAWGGYSKATTSALEWLQWRGLLRIARREAGIRVYSPSALAAAPAASAARLRTLLTVHARIFAPSPEKHLLKLMARYRDLGTPKGTLTDMIRRGELRRETVDGIDYVWPAGDEITAEPAHEVRFLAPFDPVVWDRARFQTFWGWAYRFEAYTPISKRVRGYYAMPLLWGEDVIGWANASLKTGTRGKPMLDVQLGFNERRPAGRRFTHALDQEIGRLDTFLKTKGGPGEPGPP